MTNRYALWMRVDVLHQYFSDGKCQGITFIPTAQTRAALAASGLRSKQVGNSLLVIIATDGAGKPRVVPDPALRLAFYLEPDPVLTTLSNVDLDGLRRGRFHFSNVTGNAVGVPPDPVLHLSRPLPSYEAAVQYSPGALVQRAGRAFECLEPSLGNDPEAAGTTSWLDKGQAAFASNADFVPIRASASRFELASAASAFDIEVFGLEPATNAYTRAVSKQRLGQAGGEAVKEVLLDLGALPATRYRVQINGQSFEAFFDDEAKARNPLGIVELFHHLEPDDPYSPIDAAGVVREPTYTIAFANRRAYWKYLTPLQRVNDILPAGALPGPSPFEAGPDKAYYRSKAPLGLSQSPEENAFELVLANHTRPAPRPDPRMPGTFTSTYDEPSGTFRDPVFNIRLNL